MKKHSARILKIIADSGQVSVPDYTTGPLESEAFLCSTPRDRMAYGLWEKFSLQLVLSSMELDPKHPLFYVQNRGDSTFWGKAVSEQDKKYVITPFEGASVKVSSKLSFFPALKAGIVTVSDKGSQGERKDTSGPALRSYLHRLGMNTEATAVVPDEIPAIQEKIIDWTEHKGLHIIVLTGGTGGSPRDVTPEALLSIGEKTLMGLGEYMRMKTVLKTPRAILSRSLAVLYRKTLVICLPGSRKGALECIDSVAPVLRHAIEIAQGWGGDCGHDHG